MARNITTIKLLKETKERIDKLRVYRRETYDEILQELLNILNICKVNPESARQKLLAIDIKKKRDKKIPSTSRLKEEKAPQISQKTN